MKNPHSIANLEAFFREVASLTLNHETIRTHDFVSAPKLRKALEKVDPAWRNDWINVLQERSDVTTPASNQHVTNGPSEDY